MPYYTIIGAGVGTVVALVCLFLDYRDSKDTSKPLKRNLKEILQILISGGIGGAIGWWLGYYRILGSPAVVPETGGIVGAAFGSFIIGLISQCIGVFLVEKRSKRKKSRK